MPHNKKHHYVPRFYLKRFSNDGKSINLWNIPRQKRVHTAQLQNQCYKNYFYGDNSQVERSLGAIESRIARLLREIDNRNSLPSPASEEFFLIIIYLLIQHGRTKYSAEAVDEFNDKFAKHLLRPKTEEKGIDLEQFRIGIEDASLVSLGFSVRGYPLLLDLDYKLLINKTGVDFITSDNPVVLYNQFFSSRRFGSNTGLASKGLQLLFPISPTKTLIFYDGNVYSVGKRNKAIVGVKLLKDVCELNTLQMTSALSNVYFRDCNQDVELLHGKAEMFRRQQKTTFSVFSGRENEGEESELIATSRVDVRTNLRLSFLKTNFSAKRWKDRFQKSDSQPTAALRNEKLYQEYEEFTAKVDAGEYNAGEFHLFQFDKRKSFNV